MASTVPSVEALKVEFERYPKKRRKISASYDELKALFLDPEMSWEDIAKRYGVTRAAIRQLFNRSFRPVIGRTGIELRRSREQLAFEDAVRDLPNRNPWLHAVSLTAEKAGLTVHQVPTKQQYASVLRTRTLMIEGLLCEVRRATHAQALPKKPDHWHVGIRFTRPDTSPVDAYIVHAKVDGRPELMFVIPRNVVCRIPRRSDHVHAWIPLQKGSRYESQKRRVDWYRYLDAWHLLEGE